MLDGRADDQAVQHLRATRCFRNWPRPQLADVEEARALRKIHWRSSGHADAPVRASLEPYCVFVAIQEIVDHLAGIGIRREGDQLFHGRALKVASHELHDEVEAGVQVFLAHVRRRNAASPHSPQLRCPRRWFGGPQTHGAHARLLFSFPASLQLNWQERGAKAS
eukprot:scaffold902_cov242-Pinguiococcus_pyrenoidosus.AAC.9